MTTIPDRERGDAAASDRPLTMPLLVRGGLDPNTRRSLLFLATLIAILVAMDATYLIAGKPFELLLMVLFPAGFALIALGIFLCYFARRCWLEVTLTGVILTRRGQRVAVGDEQIIAVSRLNVIAPAGVIERVIWLEIDREGALETIECHYGIPRNQNDPLNALFQRVFGSLSRRTREGLSQGAALSGKGWRVDRDGLHCKVGRKRTIYPLECLSRVGRHGGYLCLWKGTEERPFLRIPLGSRNAYPLEVFLQESILANPARAQDLPDKPLGRMLLRCHHPDRGRGLAAAALALASALFLITMGLPPVTVFWQLVCLVLGTLTLCLAPVGILQFLWSNRPTIHFHEAGVSQPNREGVRELLYTDVETMSWKDGKEILLTPRAGSDRPVIHYRSAYGHDTAELIGYRDHAASIIARRWLAELEKGPVTWTPRLRFLADGLECRVKQAISSGAVQTVPYDKIGYRFERGQCVVFVQGGPAALMRERLGGVNFFPGLTLLRMIQERSQPSAATDDVKSLAPRMNTLQAATLDKTAAQADIRITATGAPSRAVTAEIPDAGELVEDDE
jgi:hypothetical protein